MEQIEKRENDFRGQNTVLEAYIASIPTLQADLEARRSAFNSDIVQVLAQNKADKTLEEGLHAQLVIDLQV